MNEDKVLQVANFVRETIEKNTDFQCDKSYNILDFPNKCCDYASWLLWNFLREKGINGFRYIYAEGTYENREFTHVWLENDIYALDITCDQYNCWWDDGVFNKVILVPKIEHYFGRMRNMNLNHFSIIESPIDEYDSHILYPGSSDFNILDFYEAFIHRR